MTNLGMEGETIEFKKSTSELVDGVISISSMLNKHENGILYFGVKNNGDVIGQKNINDSTIRDISRKIAEGIKPQLIPEITIEDYDGLEVIKVKCNGRDVPYSAFDKYYIRSADEDKKMSQNTLKALLFENVDKTVEIESKNQDLTFDILKLMYKEKGYTINDNFEKNHGLLTKTGKYNFLAYLLADENRVSIKVATFSGNDKSHMLNRNEYGNTCLIVALNKVLDYVDTINVTKVKVGGFQRQEERYFDNDCFKEAWINAVVHNDWITGSEPAVYVYDDKIEIFSSGGLSPKLSLEDFFSGVSAPINKQLLEIFADLGIVERNGHGVPLIVGKYGKDVFNISNYYIQVIFPLNKMPIDDKTLVKDINLNESEIKILEIIKDNPKLTREEIMKKTSLSERNVAYIISNLKEKGYIERVGSNKSGYWQLLK